MCSITVGGESCIMFWGSFDQNAGVHGNRKPPLTYNGENGVSTFYRLLFILAGNEELLSVNVFNYIPFGFEVRIWDLIVSVSDNYLSFYLTFLFWNRDMLNPELGVSQKWNARWRNVYFLYVTMLPLSFLVWAIFHIFLSISLLPSFSFLLNLLHHYPWINHAMLLKFVFYEIFMFQFNRRQIRYF